MGLPQSEGRILKPHPTVAQIREGLEVVLGKARAHRGAGPVGGREEGSYLGGAPQTVFAASSSNSKSRSPRQILACAVSTGKPESPWRWR